MARLVVVRTDEEQLLACSECLERGTSPPWRPATWGFCLAEAFRDLADQFELRYSNAHLEYRVVESPAADVSVKSVWKPWPDIWGPVVCFGCFFEMDVRRTFDPKSGDEISVMTDLYADEEDPPVDEPPPNWP